LLADGKGVWLRGGCSQLPIALRLAATYKEGGSVSSEVMTPSLTKESEPISCTPPA
jgi:hypothetical protein